VEIHAENFRERFEPAPGPPWGRHPLLEAALAHVGVPAGVALAITIHSEMPAGASTGTSAAVTVALLGALYRLAGVAPETAAIARAAHVVEVERLGRQSGIQDQIAAAHGGVSFIDMRSYPEAVVTPVLLARETAWALEEQLLLVYLGRSHDSSGVHRAVIAGLETDRTRHAPLDRLRAAASAARDAVVAGDLAALGRAMRENTAAQSALHPRLVGDAAQAVIELARSHGALGWKVNGAGGDGGSLTVLTGPSGQLRRRLAEAIAKAGEGWRVIPTRLSREGLRVWDGEHRARGGPELYL
jgi:D-glycero-alpha-D-manno-heptose-7-phosphate kinase